jgi:translation initiation factor IF-3
VKASLRFRGREMAHRNLGRDMIDRLIRDVSEKAIVEFAPRMEGNTMHAILAPPRQVPGGKKPEQKPAPPQAPPAGAAKTGS